MQYQTLNHKKIHLAQDILSLADSDNKYEMDSSDKCDVDNRLSKEIDRLEKGQTTPSGWSYLWNVGPSDIYQQHLNSCGSVGINCHTSGDAGILQKIVDLPLTKNIEISWRWCMHQLARHYPKNRCISGH